MFGKTVSGQARQRRGKAVMTTWNLSTEHYTDTDVKELADNARKQGIEIPEDIEKFAEFYLWLLEGAWLNGYTARMEGK